MAFSLPNIVFTLLNGGLGILSASEDSVSCMLWYDADPLPAGRYFNAAEVLAAADTATVTLSDECIYQVSEYFRMAPGKELIFAQLDTPQDVEDLAKIQRQFDGRIRQAAIGGVDSSATPTLGEWITRIATDTATLFTEQMPLIAITRRDPDNHAAVVTSTPPLVTTAPTLAAARKWVGLVIGGEVDADDNRFAGLGATLGVLAATPVNRSVGAVAYEENQLSDGLHYTALHIDGIDYSAFTASALSAVTALGVIFPRLKTGKTGAWMNADLGLDEDTSDFKFLSRGRTMQKAIRGLNIIWADLINNDWDVSSTTGFLSKGEIKAIEGAGYRVINAMVKAGEISGGNIYIDPNQDILSTNTLIVKVQIVARGITMTINVPIGFYNPAAAN